jgi:hypothetical protein
MTPQCNAIAFAVLLLTAAPGVARADDFSDFRIPANRVLLWNGSVNGSARWQGNTHAEGHNESGGEYGNLTTAFFYRREDDSRLRDLSLNVRGSGDRSHNASRDLDPFLRLSARDAMERTVNGSLAVRDIEHWYPGRLPVSVIGEVAGNLDDWRRWASSRDLVSDTTGYYFEGSDASNQWDYANTLSGSLGVGVGRVRNATGLYEALVFEQRLLSSGALSRPLGPEAKRQLAALFYARRNYSGTMDRPAATVWGAIEDILHRDGALAGGTLDARRLFETVNPFIGSRSYGSPDALPVSPVIRLRGWSVQAIASARTEQQIRRLERNRRGVFIAGGTPFVSRTFDRVSQPADAVGGGLQAEFHRPAGLRWQLDASLRAEASVASKRHGFSERAAGSAMFIVADRWLASASLSHQRIVERHASRDYARDGWALENAASLAYWLNDHLDLNLSLRQAWSHYRRDPYFYRGFGSRGQYGQASVGIGYRFASFTEVPGITSSLH